MIRRRSFPAGKPVDVASSDVFAGGSDKTTLSEDDDIFNVSGGGAEKGFSAGELEAAGKPMTEEVDILKSLDLKL
jgi:hypothetical protein